MRDLTAQPECLAVPALTPMTGYRRRREARPELLAIRFRVKMMGAPQPSAAFYQTVMALEANAQLPSRLLTQIGQYRENRPDG